MNKNKVYNQTAEELLERNRQQSELHSSPGAMNKRRFYREEHPTEIAAFKCMDGRLNLSLFTETPSGIIQPLRTMGGIFDLGDERLGKIIQESVEYAIKRKRRYMPLCTYHFSKGNAHRGCAGHDYDTKAAMQDAKRLAEQFRFTFADLGSGNGYGQEIYPIVVGLETDHHALYIHSSDGKKVFRVDEHLHDSLQMIRQEFVEMFPSMAPQMLADLLELVGRNQHHVQEIIALNRPPIDLEHRESVICFGRGFAWLHVPNKALIIGPFGNDLSASIATADSVILGNIKAKRIDPAKGIVVMTAGLYYNEGMNKRRIMLKSYDLYRYIKAELEKSVPELVNNYNVQYLVGITSHDTQLFTEIDVDEFEKRFNSGFALSDEEENAVTVDGETVEVK